MIGKIFVTSSGYDPEKGKDVKDPDLGPNPSLDSSPQGCREERIRPPRTTHFSRFRFRRQERGRHRSREVPASRYRGWRVLHTGRGPDPVVPTRRNARLFAQKHEEEQTLVLMEAVEKQSIMIAELHEQTRTSQRWRAKVCGTGREAASSAS